MWYVLNQDKSVKCGFKFKVAAGENETLVESSEKPVVGYNKKMYLPVDLPEMPLSYFKEQKLKELKEKFNAKISKAYVLSSLGFEVDANETAGRNIANIITLGEEPVNFCDYNNVFHELTLDEVKIIQSEVINYQNELYQKKWNYRKAIEDATSFEEATIEFVF